MIFRGCLETSCVAHVEDSGLVDTLGKSGMRLKPSG